VKGGWMAGGEQLILQVHFLNAWKLVVMPITTRVSTPRYHGEP
jgi:hypothetical protein